MKLFRKLAGIVAIFMVFTVFTGFTAKNEKKEWDRSFYQEAPGKKLKFEYKITGDDIEIEKTTIVTPVKDFLSEVKIEESDLQKFIEDYKEKTEKTKGVKYEGKIEDDNLIEVLEINYKEGSIKELNEAGLVSGNPNAKRVSMKSTADHLLSLNAVETTGKEDEYDKKLFDKASASDKNKSTTEKSEKSSSEKSGDKKVFEGDINGMNVKITYTVNGDKVLDMDSVNTHKPSSESEKKELISNIEQLMKKTKDMEGVVYEYKDNGETVAETCKIDFEKADLKAVSESGLMNITGDSSKGISYKKSKENLESQGLKEVK